MRVSKFEFIVGAASSTRPKRCSNPTTVLSSGVRSGQLVLEGLEVVLVEVRVGVVGVIVTGLQGVEFGTGRKTDAGYASLIMMMSST
jgi:hypothetical protein